MIKRTERSLVLLFLACFFAVSPALLAKNPLAGYFSNLFDETRLEVDIGSMLWNSIRADYGDRLKIASSSELDALVTRLAPLSPRPNLPYQVIVLDSPIPAEIPFPGGPILFTAGLLSMADTPEAREFLVARNICHCALRHPLMMLKKESLYARALKLLKRRPEQRSSDELRELVRDYIKNVPNLDQMKADREGLALCLDPEKSRLTAIAFLNRWSQALLPIMPWDWLDLPARIQALEKLSTAP